MTAEEQAWQERYRIAARHCYESARVIARHLHPTGPDLVIEAFTEGFLHAFMRMGGSGKVTADQVIEVMESIEPNVLRPHPTKEGITWH